VTPVAELPAQQAAEERSFVSDALHKLSQPLTALHCSLELSLARDRTPKEFRASVEAALKDAERLRQRLLLLRELSDADDPGDTSAPVELKKLLQDLQEDLLPVFESAGGRFDVDCSPVQVRGNAAKLTRAFFYLLEFLLRSSPQPTLKVGVRKVNGCAEVRVKVTEASSAAVSSDDLPGAVPSGEVEIARRTLRAAGGDLTLVESASGQIIWTASLSLAL
jgi:signal transduction histidine kinase